MFEYINQFKNSSNAFEFDNLLVFRTIIIYTYFWIKKITKFNVIINLPNQLNQIVI
jgi:hypothetical protein